MHRYFLELLQHPNSKLVMREYGLYLDSGLPCDPLHPGLDFGFYPNLDELKAIYLETTDEAVKTKIMVGLLGYHES